MINESQKKQIWDDKCQISKQSVHLEILNHRDTVKDSLMLDSANEWYIKKETVYLY